MRPRWPWVALGLFVLAVAAPIAIGAMHDDLARKIEVYRAFLRQYGEGHQLNLANATTRFDAPSDSVLVCAPTVLLTTLLSRRTRTTALRQSDFPGLAVRIVDPADQVEQIEIHDPSTNIRSARDIDDAVSAAFDAGLLEVSEVGFDVTGRRAVLSYSFRCECFAGTAASPCLNDLRKAGSGPEGNAAEVGFRERCGSRVERPK